MFRARTQVVHGRTKLLLAGCGGVGKSDSGSASDENATVTLTMMGFATGDDIAKTRFDAANAAIAPSAAKASEALLHLPAGKDAMAEGHLSRSRARSPR